MQYMLCVGWFYLVGLLFFAKKMKKIKKKACQEAKESLKCAASCGNADGWSGSSVWLERSPVTAEVASSSLVRFAHSAVTSVAALFA